MATSLDFCGLHLSSPVVMLSGCVGYGDEYTRIDEFSNDDAGALILKGAYASPRPGNQPHRIAETASGLLNSIGLQNPGAEKIINEILPDQKTSAHIFANVCGSSIEEYAEVTKAFNLSPVSAMEINISCPNVKRGGVEFGNNPEMSQKVIRACRQETDKPIIAKLSPNQTSIAESAEACIAGGADGLSVINTVMGMAIDIKKRAPVLGNTQGGLSGPAIKPIALLSVFKVYKVASNHQVPIIGQGGIYSPSDAIEFILAGATAVGLGTGLFYDPFLIKKINAYLIKYMKENGFDTIDQMVGLAHKTS
jgi:dihydroorotate dehydrogenase (NAD+) catalytic subunit